MSEQPVPIWQDGIVDPEVFQNLDDCQRCARQDALLIRQRCVWIEETDVLVEIEDVAMGQAFDVLRNGHDVAEVVVLLAVEDWVVDDYAIDACIRVCCEDGIFDVIASDPAKFEGEAAVVAGQ